MEATAFELGGEQVWALLKGGDCPFLRRPDSPGRDGESARRGRCQQAAHWRSHSLGAAIGIRQAVRSRLHDVYGLPWSPSWSPSGHLKTVTSLESSIACAVSGDRCSSVMMALRRSRSSTR